jgi:hypothetical protein
MRISAGRERKDLGCRGGSWSLGASPSCSIVNEAALRLSRVDMLEVTNNQYVVPMSMELATGERHNLGDHYKLCIKRVRSGDEAELLRCLPKTAERLAQPRAVNRLMRLACKATSSPPPNYHQFTRAELPAKL